jgi:hypothetical protein
MIEARRVSVLHRHTTSAVAVAALLAAVWSPPVRATMKYGSLQLSGNIETQNLVRDPSPDEFKFVQNRNTVRLRLDWNWLQNGRFLGKLDLPFIERSNLFLLYRGVYDGFYDIAPTDLQTGQTRLDDLVGGPIAGNRMGTLGPDGKLKPGLYSRLSHSDRTDLKFEDSLREIYIDFKLKNLPVSFRLGRQQVIWGESDQFRLMDIWNPLDTGWHLQQESWDNLRVPLWLGKALWDIGQLGPLSNTFLEVVYNPFDFEPNVKLDFLPRPWAMPFPNPIRNGQVQQVAGLGYFATDFDMQGTSFRQGDFKRNPRDASEVGVRFHAVTPQGIEFSVNYLYARTRQVGANNPVALKIDEVDLIVNKSPGEFTYLDQPGSRITAGTTLIKAKTQFPYNHIFGLTANYFDENFTSAVLRLETAYVTNEPYMTTEFSKLPPVKLCLSNNGSLQCFPTPARAPQGYDQRDSWAGMIGFDRPTWIRFLNSKATWLLTGQFFWSYIPGNVSFLRGNSGAGETPYFTPPSGPGSRSQGLLQWQTGPYAGATERVQAGNCVPGAPCLPGGTPDPSGDAVRRWEHLITFAATSFYRGGTVVPFIANAWDPVNDNYEFSWTLDYYYTNNFIITLSQRLFTTYGSKAPSDDPWYVAGRLSRRDETGIKLTYQF